MSDAAPEEAAPTAIAMSDPANPLLDLRSTIAFDRIDASHVRPAITQLLKQAEDNLLAIEQEDAPPSYAGTLGALDAATLDLRTAMGVVDHLESVKSSDSLREVYNAVQPEVSAFYAGIPLREKLWKRIQAFAETAEARNLDGPKARHLQLTLNDFKRSGAELPAEGKARLQAISRELAELTARFGQNVLDETARFEHVEEDETRLAGLPAAAVDAARADAESKGKAGYRFTLQGPSLMPVMTYLEARDIRERVWRAYNTRASGGTTNNVPIIENILRLRTEQAKLLGYENFAEMVLEDRMAKTATQARDFVADLRDRSERAFQRETNELHAYAQQLSPPSGAPLQPWDVGYYAEKERKARYDFDEELLRPYFAIQNVLSGLFEIATRLYGIAISPNNDLPRWHESVQAFDIHDDQNRHIASFYADLYPREEKRGGAWMNYFISGVVDERSGEMSPHLGLICANVTPPLGDKPALLSHGEVTTLFHEFGHLLHHCLSRVTVPALVGTNVAWDFVELPSQIMENWCWERGALDAFARHWESGEAVPQALFDSMTRARTYRAASAMMRQLSFADVDLSLHVDYTVGGEEDLLDFARRIMQRYAPTPFPDDYAMLASFTHLFSSPVGYAAGYYSYKWAEVLDADAFTRFKTEGIFNRETGRAFLDSILGRGNTRDPSDLYREFMGREPDLNPLLERSGLASAASL